LIKRGRILGSWLSEVDADLNYKVGWFCLSTWVCLLEVTRVVWLFGILCLASAKDYMARRVRIYL